MNARSMPRMGPWEGRVKNIFAKLGANDRAHAVMIGLKRGIIQP